MNATLLLVEDHEDTRNAVARVLKKKGYQVLCAKSGAEALKLATDIRFDLVVMDHGLPDGNGCAFMQVLHRIYMLEGIALTANAYASDERMSREAGFRAHLNKPVNVEKLCEAIESCLGEKKNAPAVPVAQIDRWVGRNEND